MKPRHIHVIDAIYEQECAVGRVRCDIRFRQALRSSGR